MTNPIWHEPTMTRSDRWSLHSLCGITIWLTGLSGSGKSTIAHETARQLHQAGVLTYVLDADNIRHGLNNDLGFRDSDRLENNRRIAEVARLCSDAGLVTFVPIISAFEASRAYARKIHTDDDLTFIEVYVATPLEECERRDTKGLYALARAGKMAYMTGVDSPYEVPQQPDVVLGAHDESLDVCTQILVGAITSRLNLKH